MPNQGCSARAYWTSRGESAEDGAARLVRCLCQLQTLNPVLDRWYAKTRTRDEMPREVEVTSEALTALLLRGQIRREQGGYAIPKLGYSAALWNGRGEDAADFSVTCGATASDIGVLNHFVVKLEPSSKPSEPIGCSMDLGAALIDAIVRAWEPDWATWSDHRLRDAQAAAPGQPILGWITYLKSGCQIPDVSDIAVVSEANDGHLVAVRDSSSSVTTERVIELGRRLGRCL